MVYTSQILHRLNFDTMKHSTSIVLFFLTLSLSSFTWFSSVTWKISDDYSIRFSSDDPTGVFKDLKGDIIFSPSDLPNSRFDVSVAVNSINTGNGMQNNHAKSSKWFDAKQYPEITFKSENITRVSTGYEAKGKLSIHGITKEFTIPFGFTENSDGGIFTSTFEVNRVDFKIGEPGGRASEVIKLEISVPVTK